MSQEIHQRLRTLPQVGEMLDHPVLSAAGGPPSWAVKEALREVLDARRQALRAGDEADTAPDAVAADALTRARELARFHLRRVINATGVVIHTNLGRSPLAPGAVARVREVAGGYSNLEFDVEAGKRGGRGRGVAELVSRLTGAEAAIVVNNNAAAVFLALRVLSEGREAVVSRGELVEIGGSFRIPDVMRSSGAILREVGTTNRTHPRDYENAIGDRTGLLLKVHRSNFRVVGFVAEVGRRELVAIGERHGVPVVEDLGSGRLLPSEVGDEPRVADAIEAGVDLACFSGDKLLGGCQAGIIAGRRTWIERLAKDPLMRVLRVDKLTYAALEGTLRHVLDGEADQVPTHRMVHASPDSLLSAAHALETLLRAKVPALEEHFDVQVREVIARAGGGALAQVDLPGHALRLRPLDGAAGGWAERLRLGRQAVLVRVADDCVWLDPRTLLPGDDEALAGALGECIR